jgi:dTDP-4-amino-4,6-dideoxygalactose transaminase
MQVPFLDLRDHNRSVRWEVRAALDPVLNESQFILGPAVEQFEREFADYLGARYCIGLNNGTSALHLALLACDVQPGHEVITTPATWISTSWAISYVGARPVYVDVDPLTYTLDPVLVERAITPRTKAILPVHLYGQAADLSGLKKVADQHGLALVEDAAQAHGAWSNAGRVGTVGKAGCFSFYPGKNLGAFGEAGCVVTNDDAVARRIRCLRDHSQDGRHNHVEIGFNARMEGIQGAVLSAKLVHLDDWNAARARHATRYHELLAGVPAVTRPIALQPDAHAWHLYVIMVHGRNRDAIRQALAQRGVATGVHYPTPVPFQPAYAYLQHRRGEFPVAEQLMERCISLPMYPEMRPDQIEYAAESLRSVMGGGHV